MFNNQPITGVTFPLRVDNGKVPMDNGFDVLRSSILMILGWPMFQRYFLHKFGSRLYECEEEPNDSVLISILKFFIIESVAKWETRVVLDASKIYITQNMNNIEVIVYYKVKSLGVEDYINLTYKNTNLT